MNRSLPLIVVATLALAGCSRARPADARTTGLGFSGGPCTEDFSGFANRVECGTMTVEETRGANNGRTVSFPVVIVRATEQNAKPDPVIFLHGGPGGDIVDGLAAALKRGVMPITPDRDWIFFDERGTGQSTPLLDCGELPLSDAGVTTDDGVRALQACGKDLSAKGIDLSQYNSATIVKDIRDLRAALRIGTYNLFGMSYGTRVAAAVMQHDPEDLRAVVMDSVWPPEANATAPLPELVSREVRQVISLCAADHACSTRYPDLERRFDARLVEWLKTPATKDGKTYTAEDAAAYLLDALYGTASARALPVLIDALIKGDYRALDDFLKTQSDYVEGQFFAHMCKEEFPFESLAAVDSSVSHADPIADATARDVRRFFPVCDGFKVGTIDPVENQPLVSDIPTLLLTADIDAGCPAELSEAAVKRLSHGAHFNFLNRTHGVSRQSPCARAMVLQFLTTADPRVDSTCVRDDQPKFQFNLSR